MADTPSIVVLHNPVPHIRRHLLFSRLRKKLPDNAYMFASTGDFAADLKALKAACQHADLLVAVGGDGTLNLAVNAIANTQTTLGVIPAGSGNDFARVWVAGLSDEEIVDAALHGNTIEIDLGQANDRYFLNNAGVGFDGELIRRLKHKTWPRKFSYVSRTLALLPHYRSAPIAVESDAEQLNDGPYPKSFMLSIGNSRYFGAGLPITTHARLNDGLLAYTHIKEKRRTRTVRCLMKLLIRQHLRDKQVIAGQLTDLRVKTAGIAVQVDGEYLGYSPVDIKVCPGALKINKL